jgi:membrane-associated phospholipid phosphatase
MNRHIALVAALAAAAPAPALAEDTLEVRGARDAAITVAAATSFLTLELFRDRFLASGCRWCDTAGDGSSALNMIDRGVRDSLVWSDPARAHMASNISLFGGAMIAPVGLGVISAVAEGRSGNIGEDLLVVSQATFLALSVNSLSKIAFQRQRPYAHAKAMSAEAFTGGSADDNVSFFSGHTTLAFSMAVSAGTVASMRNYELAPAIWGVGLTSAVATGYFRIAADKHYLSDVLVGAAVGSLFGAAVPLLLHGKDGAGKEGGLLVGGAPVEGGGVATVSGHW